MLVEFDPAKNAKNLRERGIGHGRFVDTDFDTAIAVDDTRRDCGERRMRVLGNIDSQLHAAVITPRGAKIRVISLRRANKRERHAYAKERRSG